MYVVKHSMLLMYADDAKCAKLVRNQEDCSELQDDLNSLCSWSLQWNLKFKESKCILLRCCNNAHSIAMKYTMNNCEIPCRDEHRDLGVMFSSDLSFRPHYNYIVRRAYQVLGLLRRTFSSSSDVRVRRLLYISLVRSQFTYCSQLWRPYLLKDVELLEGVQRRATKYLLNDFKSDYKSRLVALGLMPLMYFLELNDIMFCVKSLKSPSRDFNIYDHVHFSKCGTRSSAAMKMSHNHSMKNSSRHSYFNRLLRLWNSLPPPINLDLLLFPSRTTSVTIYFQIFIELLLKFFMFIPLFMPLCKNVSTTLIHLFFNFYFYFIFFRLRCRPSV